MSFHVPLRTFISYIGTKDIEKCFVPDHRTRKWLLCPHSRPRAEAFHGKELEMLSQGGAGARAGEGGARALTGTCL